ncbi:hypothetical protein WICPIJ_002195 [Wickerhamomyces pijperi]|uniref:Uncharacterized protein n=1 Tax=Wickerhamomyces pijperi TaxID=599730 RepID=A0A9P8Q9K2_WICPI|nr:hypothetical protein WICPIJ_002195 [Wickerhamomyces pijperi]
MEVSPQKPKKFKKKHPKKEEVFPEFISNCLSSSSGVSDNSDSHGSQQVVSSVRMTVNTTVESSGGVLTNRGSQQRLTTWMCGDVASNIVHDTVDDDITGRVDTESGLLDEAGSQDPSVDEPTKVIVEEQTTHQSWENKGHEHHDGQVVSVLHSDNPVINQVGDIGTGLVLWVRLG